MDAPTPPAPRRPALTDVATLAGVSHMTVSRVINDTGPVKPETRARVLAAIQELDYRPNSAARTLATGRSQTLGVVTLDSTLFGPASTLYGIENAARQSGYAINISSLRTPDRTSIGDAVESLRSQAVEGIIVIAPHDAAVRALAYVPRHVPMVAVGVGSGAVPRVSVDQVDGARRATEHLLSLGHETVWHVGGPPEWLEARAREESWRETLERHGIAPPAPLLRGDWSPRSGYEQGRLLVQQRHLTAVFVANDQMALGVLRALGEAGVRVPQDVNIVGFDDVPEAAYFNPPLTTVRQDFIEVGRRTFDLLLEQIWGEQTDGKPAPGSSTVPAELIIRDSTSPRSGS